MDPFSIASMIGGGISSAASTFLDPLMNIELGQISSKKQFKYQRRLMEIQQAWAEKMRSTAHQTEVADLRKAGLNPILSAMNGAGAVTPSVSVPAAPLPDYGDFKFNSSAIDRLQDIKQRDIAIQNSKKQGQLIDSQVARERAETLRIFSHIAEGVGTPRQTENVIYNVVNQGVDALLDSGKESYNIIKETMHNVGDQKIREFLMEQRLKRMRKEKERNF